MPKPPGSGMQFRPRAPPSPAWRDVPPRHVLHVSEAGELVTAAPRRKGASRKKLRRGRVVVQTGPPPVARFAMSVYSPVSGRLLRRRKVT